MKDYWGGSRLNLLPAAARVRVVKLFEQLSGTAAQQQRAVVELMPTRQSPQLHAGNIPAAVQQLVQQQLIVPFLAAAVQQCLHSFVATQVDSPAQLDALPVQHALEAPGMLLADVDTAEAADGIGMDMGTTAPDMHMDLGMATALLEPGQAARGLVAGVGMQVGAPRTAGAAAPVGGEVALNEEPTLGGLMAGTVELPAIGGRVAALGVGAAVQRTTGQDRSQLGTQRSCSLCHMHGHYKTTCPARLTLADPAQQALPPNTVIPDFAAPSTSTSRQRKPTQVWMIVWEVRGKGGGGAELDSLTGTTISSAC
jgi:hypothetical protein